MANRTALSCIAAFGCMLAGCSEPSTGPVTVSAIGGDPELVNPNLEPLDPAKALRLISTAQGLVAFDAAGQIEPALAQSWIVSDDGLRYTFRLRPAQWEGGGEVEADEVAARLRAAGSAASRNPLKPLLGAIDDIVAMTDEVIEISLVAPRANFLQLLAQPEMAIVRDDAGTGPFRASPGGQGWLRLDADADQIEPASEEEEPLTVLLRGEPVARAVARFAAGAVDYVAGGSAGDLPVAQAAELGRGDLRFDPAIGLFGLAFVNPDGFAGTPEVRRALSMAVNREAMGEALGVPDFRPRLTLIPPGNAELARPVGPAWATLPIDARRAQAAAAVAAAASAEAEVDEAETPPPPIVRVAMPEGLGYRLVFARLRSDWRRIGVTAERVPMDDRRADLRLVDSVARADLAGWYLRQFTCDANPVCDPVADEALEAARLAPNVAAGQRLLARADSALADAVVYLPLASPTRWSLVSGRLTGFTPNLFARHNPAELIVRE